MADPELQARAAKAQKIIAHPSKYKVCEGCDSIVGAQVGLCPNCNGYRFDADAEVVADQARLLASRAQTSVRAEDLM